ncbi:regulatory LuxR family protein [Raoultella sp. BIGb0399]|uniref:helix-turn-helix transcriptional regulator n=1 Tax=Raoultella sp. BIGb0399 TaxID=2485119 RepID=UPI000F4C2B62|nr:LuxR C-terminal-related transcriptional regulator [Raoultella sp. BIGb0399]ROS15907.1 regulatory LuxR family protein [Raoultella sp. BIGb0399]
MTTILINTSDIFLRQAITHLVTDIIADKGRDNPLVMTDMSNIADAEVIITEMTMGEHLLCQKALENRKAASAVFIIQPRTATTPGHQLPTCIHDATFIHRQVSVTEFSAILRRKLSAMAGFRRSVSRPDNPRFKCIKCPRKSLTPTQLKVAQALGIGMNSLTIADHLQVHYKTIFSHKSNIMKSFEIANKQELNRFISVIMRNDGQIPRLRK